ncbi:MAG TPA: head GIN domain-containing protein [Thermomicrobiales bacterium]|nr:head GIN domain-containing protein [Thermomicrobiales bacterium]
MVDHTLHGGTPGEAGGPEDEYAPFIAAEGGRPPTPRPAYRPARRSGGGCAPLLGCGLLALAAVALVGVLVGGIAFKLALGAPGTRGSGHVVTESRPVAAFQEIAVSGVGTLVVTQGDREALTIQGEDNILPDVRTDVRDGRLTIGLESQQAGWGWMFDGVRPTKPLTYTVTVKDLRAVQLSGAAAMTAANLDTDRLTLDIDGAGAATLDHLTTGDLRVTISGAGKVTAAGAATAQAITISGDGEYRAGDLTSTRATVDISGAGKTTLRVSDSLTARVSGAGIVQYIGAPSVSRDISGAGKVAQLRDQ